MKEAKKALSFVMLGFAIFAMFCYLMPLIKIKGGVHLEDILSRGTSYFVLGYGGILFAAAMILGVCLHFSGSKAAEWTGTGLVVATSLVGILFMSLASQQLYIIKETGMLDSILGAQEIDGSSLTFGEGYYLLWICNAIVLLCEIVYIELRRLLERRGEAGYEGSKSGGAKRAANSPLSRIESAYRLKEHAVLTDEEYQTKKRAILKEYLIAKNKNSEQALSAELLDWKALLDAGVLCADEFALVKKKLMGV